MIGDWTSANSSSTPITYWVCVDTVVSDRTVVIGGYPTCQDTKPERIRKPEKLWRRRYNLRIQGLFGSPAGVGSQPVFVPPVVRDRAGACYKIHD